MLDAIRDVLGSDWAAEGAGWGVAALAVALTLWIALRWQRRRGLAMGAVERQTLQARVDHANSMLTDRIDAMIALRDRLAKQSAAMIDMELRIHELTKAAPPGALEPTAPAALEEALTGKLWMRPVAESEQRLLNSRSRIPILAVGNLKGGVGKTTTAANLGGFYALGDGPNQRVLFLDFDFQGSLSSILRNAAGVIEPVRLMTLFDENRTIEERLMAAHPLPVDGFNPGCEFYDSDFPVAQFEETLKVDWARRTLLAGPDAPGASPDLRFLLKRFLHAPEVQSRYDLVVIDMPPRDTPLAINALCAATHLIVPTRADAMSINGVVRFCGYADHWRARLNPALRLAGVVPTMTPGRSDWQARFRAPLEEIARGWRGAPDQPPLLPQVPERAAIAKTAARDFAVLADIEVRLIFERLAQSLTPQWRDESPSELRDAS